MNYETLDLLTDIFKAGGTIEWYIEEVNRETLEFTGDLLGCDLSSDDGIFYDEGLFRIDEAGIALYLEESDEELQAEVIGDILERVDLKNRELELLHHQLDVLKSDLETLTLDLKNWGF